MLKKYLCASVFLLTTLTMQEVIAADESMESTGSFNFIPSIGYQHKRLKFDQTLRFPSGINKYGTDAKFDVDLPTANLGFTTSYKRMFLTFKYEKSLADGSTGGTETLQPDETSYYFNIPGGRTDVNREDMNVTLGVNVVSTLNIFVGYMRGETKIKPDEGCSWASTAPIGQQTCDTSINPFGKVNIAWIEKTYGTPGAGGGGYEHTFTENGPYIGASYAFQIADAGTLSFSAAYAKMDGTYQDNSDVFFATSTDFKFTGDSKGRSYGITWTAPLGESSNYYIDFREQHYSMDAKDANGNFPNGSATTDETMQGVTAGVQLYY